MTKPYLLFAWSQYQPEPANDGFCGAFATTDEAIAAFSTHEAAWASECWMGRILTFDGETFTVVYLLFKEHGNVTKETP